MNFWTLARKALIVLTYVTFPLVYVGIAFLLYIVGLKSLGTIIFGTWTLDTFVNQIVKYIVRRKRPEARRDIPIAVYDYSFPSWHTQSAFANLLAASSLLPFYISFFISWIPVIIAYNRLYLRHHYPSDVIGGAIIGTIVGLFCSFKKDFTASLALAWTYWLTFKTIIVGIAIVLLLTLSIGWFSFKIGKNKEEALTIAFLLLMFTYILMFASLNGTLFLSLRKWVEMIIVLGISLLGLTTVVKIILEKGFLE